MDVRYSPGIDGIPWTVSSVAVSGGIHSVQVFDDRSEFGLKDWAGLISTYFMSTGSHSAKPKSQTAAGSVRSKLLQMNDSFQGTYNIN